MFSHLLSKLPAPRIADWHRRMSVCITILCDHRKAIVTVSDLKANFGDFSAEMIALKDIPLCPGYTVLIAGDDMEHSTPILDRASSLLSPEPEGGGFRSPDEVAGAVDQAFGERLHSEIERRVLRKRGFTVQTFLDKGKQKCSASSYLSLCNRIDQVSIKLENSHLWFRQ